MKRTKGKLYTAQELEALAGVCPGTLRNYIAVGLPVAGKRKSRRGKPANLYDPLAVLDWWKTRAALGKWNWSAYSIMSKLEKLVGKKPRPRPQAEVDAELRALGFDQLDALLDLGPVPELIERGLE